MVQARRIRGLTFPAASCLRKTGPPCTATTLEAFIWQTYWFTVLEMSWCWDETILLFLSLGLDTILEVPQVSEHRLYYFAYRNANHRLTAEALAGVWQWNLLSLEHLKTICTGLLPLWKLGLLLEFVWCMSLI